MLTDRPFSIKIAAILTLSLMQGLASVSWSAEPQVGPASDGGYLVPTRQLIHPAGKVLEFAGRPFDIALSPDRKSLYVKAVKDLLVIDTDAWSIRQTFHLPEGDGSMHGIVVTRDGSKVYATTSQNIIWGAKVTADGKLELGEKIVVPGADGKSDAPSCLCGIALSKDEKTAFVCRSRCNTLGVVDLPSGKLLKDIPVGIAPYDVVLAPDGHTAFVSNMGGRRPVKGEKTSDSSGTQCVVDERGICSSGTVSVVDLAKGKESAQIETGLHPSDMRLSADGKRLFVANANSDTISIIDTHSNRVLETMPVSPDSTLPFGSAPNALTLSSGGKMLYVANGGNNAVAVIGLRAGRGGRSRVKGFIPTAWYPGAIESDGQNLYIANIKGFGSRAKKLDSKGWTSWDIQGVITKVPIPAGNALVDYTAQVKADGRVPQILRAMEKAGTGKKPVPVPERTGEPSVFQHVIYVIKENKTYDQMFGDMEKGNGFPDLCIYGRNISPNHHALADQFVLLDNYYCNGVCSADGHCWATEGNTTDYQEKEFGGFPRYYGDDSDCLDISSSGFIWDDAVNNGLSFRNYGEFGFGKTTPKASWTELYRDHRDKLGKFKVENEERNQTLLQRYSCPDYPGWDMGIPDEVRTEAFFREFKEYEKNGDLPNLITLYLPSDHTSGGQPGFPTPRAQVADNDLALGKVVETISKSRFWRDTCIFVEEDDAQSGFDHVDGHRSICLVISPYTKRSAVISNFYNQTGVLHTMERILGIPPMNQMDAMSPVMSDCFTSVPDFTPYTCLPNNIPIDEMPSSSALFYGRDKYLASGGMDNPFAEPDRINDDELNRVIWYFAKGPDVRYPSEYAGPHGKGLGTLHLKIDSEQDDDD